ncbi:MAG: CmcI family methyltransferase [Pseudomonadota bacterium]
MSYRGIRTLKNVMDMWNYQEIFAEHRIEWVLETGTRHGGSALYFADLLANSKAPGHVISVDVDSASLQIGPHPGIRLIRGGSTSPEVMDQVLVLLPVERGPLFVILDSDHRRDHVLRELELYVPMMRRGDYLIVEDTCLNGHPVRQEHGPGPWEAVEAFLERYPGLLRWDREREEKFGATFAPRGYFVRL